MKYVLSVVIKRMDTFGFLMRIYMHGHLFMMAGLCLFVISRRKDATRNDKKTPCEKTKKRISHAKRRNSPRRRTKFQREKMKNVMRKDAISRCVFCMASFSSFRVALFRLVVFSHGIFSSFSGKKTPCGKTK